MSQRCALLERSQTMHGSHARITTHRYPGSQAGTRAVSLDALRTCDRVTLVANEGECKGRCFATVARAPT